MKARIWRLVVFALRITSDRFYARIVHYLPLWRGRWPGRLHLRHPKSLSEKILWLKINMDRINPNAHLYADKLLVRDHVAEIVGEQHLIPLLGVWDRSEDIPWSDLPHRFALKTNHGVGFNIITRDRSALDVDRAAGQIDTWLRAKYWQTSREHQYRQIRPRVFAERLLGSGDAAVHDYKFWCFGGECKLVEVDVGRFSDLRCLVVDTSWNQLPVEFGLPTPDREIAKPREFDKMVSIAERLASPFVFVTVDLYEVDGSIYFGEFTFNPGNPISPPEWDRRLGDLLSLPD